MARQQEGRQDSRYRKVVRSAEKISKVFCLCFIIGLKFPACALGGEESILYLSTGTAPGMIGYYEYSDEYGGFANDVAQSFAVDADGKVYIADTFNDRVQVFNPDGKFLFHFSAADRPVRGSGYNITAGWDGSIYVSEVVFEKGNTAKYNSKNGKLVNIFAKGGSEPGEYWHADIVSADSKGNVYIYDMNLARILKYNSKGKCSAMKERSGPLAVDPGGYLYLYNGKLKMMEVYDADKDFSRPIKTINSALLRAGEILKIDKAGNYYCRMSETKIIKISPDGNRIIKEIDVAPYTGKMTKNIEVGNDGNVYVASSDYDSRSKIFFKIDKYAAE